MAHSGSRSVWTRRAFVRLAGGLAATAVVPRGLRTPPVEGRVLVLGAGVAGLTVARALHRAGTEVLVLEGRPRVGGRTHTMELAGAPVDLGAAWVHGASARNPVTACLRKLDIATTRDAGAMAAFTRDGRLAADALGELQSAMGSFVQALSGLREELGADASVADGVAAFLETYETEFDRDTVRAMLRAVGEDWYAGALEDQSLASFYEDEEFPGGDAFPVGGYGGLVRGLADGLSIDTGKRVDRVEHDHEGVRVRAGDETFEGSHVVVTLPLGVLQSGAVEFLPSLSEAKQRAIDALGMGHVEKVVLRFEEDPGEGIGGVIHLSPDPAFSLVLNLSGIAGAPTWVAFGAGSFAKGIARREREASIDEARSIVKRICDRSLPELVASHVTDWGADPCSLGAYSFEAVGSRPSDRIELARPEERLLFAGEATMPGYYATVHGALMSGMREAKRLLGREIGVDDLF